MTADRYNIQSTEEYTLSRRDHHHRRRHDDVLCDFEMHLRRHAPANVPYAGLSPFRTSIRPHRYVLHEPRVIIIQMLLPLVIVERFRTHIIV